jgi:hypothetical protein
MMEAILETKTATILQSNHGLRGNLHVTLEEGTWGAWLYDLLKPHVSEVLRRPIDSTPLIKHCNY